MKNTLKIGLNCYCCLQQYPKEKMQIGINNVEEKRRKLKILENISLFRL